MEVIILPLKIIIIFNGKIITSNEMTDLRLGNHRKKLGRVWHIIKLFYSYTYMVTGVTKTTANPSHY